ncbi:MAG TPA: Ig-like domain-containing protein, partial [Bacilli bacterium]
MCYANHLCTSSCNVKKFSFILVFVVALLLAGCHKTPKLQLNEADTEIILTIGQEKTITPLVDDGTLLDWTSSNNDIATVDDGKIKAISAGEVNITVMIVGTKISENIHLTVTYPDPISVEIIGAKDVIIGDTLKLNANVLPENSEQNVIWSSSNSNIATIDNEGNLEAIALGEVVITATVKNANIYNNVTINVIKPKPSSINILGPKDMKVGEEKAFVANINPSIAYEDIIWSVDNSNLAIITQDGILKALDEGTVEIKATSAVDDTIFHTFTVTITYPEPTSISIDGFDEIEINNTPTYIAKITPKNAKKVVRWEVDNSDVAIISNHGVLTPLKEGKCTIKAISTTNEEIFATKLITIYKTPTKIECEIPEVLVVNGFTKINPILFHNDEIIQNNITITSLDPNVLSIANDVLTAHKTGEVTITIQAIYHEDLKISKIIRVIQESDINKNNILVSDKYQDYEAFVYDNRSYVMGLNAFNSITEAMNQAIEGTTIILSSGTYDEEINIYKDNLTFTGTNATLTNKIYIKSNNITITNLTFTDKAQILGNDAGNIKNFTFTNNYVNNIKSNFLTFPVLNEQTKNENFEITNNTFTSNNQEVNFIRLSNIENLIISNNIFQGNAMDAIIILGNGPLSQESNITGIGASGIINISNNSFSNIGLRAINISLYSA